MFTLNLKGKNDIITCLTLQCLELYAKGFYYIEPDVDTQQEFSDWLDDLEFHRSTKTVEKETNGTGLVDVLDRGLYQIGNAGMALMARSPEGPICCAGGLSLTMIAEWVLNRYRSQYAMLLGDSYPQEDFDGQFENMRERVESILENNNAVRCCTIKHCYLGYLTVQNMPELERREGEDDENYRRRFQRVLQMNEMYTVSDSIRISKRKLYRFTREACNTSMKIYMMNRCYDQQNQMLIPSQYPNWLRRKKEHRQIDAMIPNKDKNWRALPEPLALDEGKIFPDSAAKQYASQFLRVMQGSYRLFWHETEGSVDSVLLVYQEDSTGFFEAEAASRQVISDATDAFEQLHTQLQERLFRETSWRMQKDKTFGLSACRDAFASENKNWMAGPHKGLRLFYEDGQLRGIQFTQICRKDFRIGVSSRESGERPQVLCFYLAGSAAGK